MARCPSWITAAEEKCHEEDLTDMLDDPRLGETVIYLRREDGAAQRVDPDTGDLQDPFEEPVEIRAIIGNWKTKELDQSTGLLQVGDKKMLFDPECVVQPITSKDVVVRGGRIVNGRAVDGTYHNVIELAQTQHALRLGVVNLRRLGGTGS